MAESIAPADAPVSQGVMLKYGVGQLGAQIFRDTPAVLLPIFMITMLGIPAWLAGLAIMVPKLWVIIFDPLVGSFSDRIESRFGRSPMLALGAVASSLGFFALFTVSDFGSPWLAAAIVSLTFLLAQTGFSAFSVPYLALAGELSKDTHERTKILVYRMIFTMIGLIIGIGAAQPLTEWFGGGRIGWMAMGGVLGMICAFTMLTTALSLWSFRADRVAEEQVGLMAQLKRAWRNKPFVLINLTNFFQNIGSACSFSVVGLIFIYSIGNISLLWPFMLAMTAGSLLSQPVWLATSKRFGKLPMFVLACIAWCLVTLSWLALGKFGDMSWAMPFFGEIRVEVILVMVRAVLIGVFNSGFVLLAISLFTDTLSYGVKPGQAPQEGSLSGVWSACEKLAFAIGPLISGAVLSIFGFVSSTGGAIAQTDVAINGVILCYSAIPAAIVLLSLFCLRRYGKFMQEEPAAAA
ncbi:MFS transporter [Parasphingorhabdus sp.]|uniref:MFS transporter n=1 Tax=Parasphingorhabdus sp. TaxID=2709688 RepID=UPI003263086A